MSLSKLAALAASVVMPAVFTHYAWGVDAVPVGGAGWETILRTATGDGPKDESGSMWRYYETWRTDIARVDGKLVHVDVFENRRKGPAGDWIVQEPAQIVGSPFPPEEWRKVEFDDSDWIRHPGPFFADYRRLALICLRGRFQVTDPSRVGDLSLTVKCQGGAVAYVNGREIGRMFMPEGPIENTTPAQDYPIESYLTGSGKLLGEFPFSALRASILTTPAETVRKPWSWDDDQVNRFKMRGRIAEFKVPASLLRVGVNVLAVEIHRAPADPIMFLSQKLALGTGGLDAVCWNRASIEELTLSAPAPAAGLVPNVRHPEGCRIWVEETLAPMANGRRFGDPNEPVAPIRMHGMRNGVCSGQAVVSSRSPLGNLRAAVGELRCGPYVIPASAVRIAYPGMGQATDGLSATALPEIEPAGNAGGHASQRVWITVKIPREATAGLYGGTLTVNVAGERPLTVPVEMKVVGTWVVPEPKDFVTFIGIHESPDSVAMWYNVPLWSEEHWRHLDKIYELLGQIGAKDIYLPILAKTHLANEQSMVRWLRQPDGSYKYDFTVFERYLDTALRHLGRAPVVCLYLHDYGFRIGDRIVQACVTEIDAKTGEMRELLPPEWGTPEALSFWKPVIDQARDILAKRGLAQSMMFGMGANNWVKQECLADLKRLYPDVLWVNRTHYYVPTAGAGKVQQAFGLISAVSGAVGVSYNPEQWEKHCGWRGKRQIINFPRNFVTLGGNPVAYRLFAEGTLLSSTMGWRGGPAGCGLGHIGADFWPVLEGSRRGQRLTLANRYVFWHSLSIDTVITAILAPSPGGPLDTTRHQMMREALQEAEASVLIREALVDGTKLARLGSELEARCRALCLERTWVLWHYTHFASYGRVFSQRQWDDLSEKLCVAAGDVARALAAPRGAGGAD